MSATASASTRPSDERDERERDGAVIAAQRRAGQSELRTAPTSSSSISDAPRVTRPRLLRDVRAEVLLARSSRACRRRAASSRASSTAVTRSSLPLRKANALRDMSSVSAATFSRVGLLLLVVEVGQLVVDGGVDAALLQQRRRPAPIPRRPRPWRRSLSASVVPVARSDCAVVLPVEVVERGDVGRRPWPR